MNDIVIDRPALDGLAAELDAGLCIDGVPINERMRSWVGQWGIEPFLLMPGINSGELSLPDDAGHAHLFRQARFAAQGGEGLWVQECPQEVLRFSRLRIPGHNPVFRLGLDGSLRYANEAGGELLRYAAGGEAAVFIRRLLPAARQALISGQNGSVELELGPRLLAFVIGALAGSDEIYLFGSDITERRHAEGALRRSEERFRALLERAPDAFIISTPEGAIEYANPRTGALFGRDPAALEGRPVDTLIPEWSRDEALRRMFEPGLPTRLPAAPVVFTGIHQTGARFPVEISSSPLERDGGIYAVSILRDVTERERAAQEIRELNQHLERHVAQLTALNGELEAFSYSVSHDLRGPLRAIEGFSAILMEDYGGVLDAAGCDHLQRIRTATGRMADLIEGLLRLSRITRAPIHSERVDLSAIARFVAEGLGREAPQRQVEFLIAEGIEAEGDRALLTVVLENLLTNAWKFTARRRPGRIEFGIRREPDGTVYFVRDNGAGFDMNYAGKLFQPFERLHRHEDYPGSGIGLATVQRVVCRHGGRIWAEGREGEGAAFFFTLSEKP